MKSICLLLILFINFQALAQENELFTERLSLDSLVNIDTPDSIRQETLKVGSKPGSLKESLNLEYPFADSVLQKNPVNSGIEKLEASRQKVNALADSLQLQIQVKIPDSLKTIIPIEAGSLPEIGIQEMDLPSINNVDGIEALEGLENLKEVEDIQNIGNIEAVPELDQVTTVTDQVTKIKEKLPNTENVSDAVEGEAKNLKGIKALEEQKGRLEGGVTDMKPLKDHEHFKEELVSKAKEKAVDHFAGHTSKLKEAQSKLADLKRKFPEGVSSIKNLPKRRPNPMKGKPFHERLILGLTIQIHPAPTPNIDVSPLAAYKISDRLSFGVGGNYRIMTKNDFKGINHEASVYGYRVFTEFKLYRGFFAHAEYELMRTQVRDSLMIKVRESVLEKEGIDGLLIGIGREYKIGGLVKGNMQVLYNFLHQPNSPYKEKVMVRFGFSFHVKDKKKRFPTS